MSQKTKWIGHAFGYSSGNYIWNKFSPKLTPYWWAPARHHLLILNDLFFVYVQFSFAMGWIFAPGDMLFRLGLFVLGCCPGGTASNFWCILLGGDINLSITMTFISTVAALGINKKNVSKLSFTWRRFCDCYPLRFLINIWPSLPSYNC